jgi:hypothetical protein
MLKLETIFVGVAVALLFHRLHRLNFKINKIMATEQEILALLEEANAATNEIAEDIDALLAREEGIPETVRTALQAHVDRLKGVAGIYTPPTTEEPETPEEPEV